MLALNLWRPEARDFYLALVITWIPESGRVFFSAPWGIHWLEPFGDRISRPFRKTDPATAAEESESAAQLDAADRRWEEFRPQIVWLIRKAQGPWCGVRFW